ncbi:GGDEF domain-containing protein [Sphingobium olei]|uniref:diguanylate cyclase n=1 Tax=Sphingobium olei TaxID=420955 RepID=A0ABW3P5P6_9SPHN|nr:diguanylate cyclase [Sphingobium sp.]
MKLSLPRTMSVATKAAITLSIVVGLLFLVSGMAAYFDIRRQALSEALVRLDSQNRQVAELQEGRFTRLRAAHEHAKQLLLAELAQGANPDDARNLDTLFPRDHRGGRRSADLLFDGGQTPFGYVRGVGAYIREEPDARQRALILRATRVAHAVGEGIRPDLKSLYFFTPGNTLIMFAPDRADRLGFYRKKAPGNLDFQQETFAKISTPELNPSRSTRCTPLVHILYDKSGKTWTTGCMTPVDWNGRHIGTWGTSLLLDDLLSADELQALPSTDTVLVSGEGMLIRHPRYTHQSKAAPEQLLDLRSTRNPELQALWQFIRSNASGSFLGHVPQLGAHVSMRRIGTPGWYILTIQNDAVIQSGAVRAVARVAITAILCVLLQVVAISLLIRRYVGKPLAQLTDRTRALSQRFQTMAVPSSRTKTGRDEVEQLAHDFDDMADKLTGAHRDLEQQVAQRTDQLHRANLELSRLADCDTLTGVPNRRRIVQDVEQRLMLHNPRRLYMLVIDIDHFKRVNDSYGHLVGDRLLTDIAHDARALLRDNDLFGRIGGEEFMALIEASGPDEATIVAERLRSGIARKNRTFVEGTGGEVTISIGIANADNRSSFAELYAAADAALYEAKHQGRNRWVLEEACRPGQISGTSVDMDIGSDPTTD